MDEPLRGSNWRRCDMPVTKDQADMLAALAAACRPNGAPRWDAPGVIAAIGKIKHLSLADVTLAVIRAADDREIRTPGVIANLRSTCWQERATDRPKSIEVIPPEQRCGICAKRRDECERAPRFRDDDHAFEPDFKRPAEINVAATVEALRAEVTEAKGMTADVPAPRKPDPRPLDREANPTPNTEQHREALAKEDAK